MITTSQLGLAFGGDALFEDVSVKFVPGNCYGLIGANGAGKSTFLKLLSGELESTSGNIHIEDGKRIAVLKQDQFAYDEFTVIETVLMGHKELYAIFRERNELYSKAELTDEEGMRVGDLEVKFGEMDGYTAEADAGVLLSGLGLEDELHQKKMSELDPGEKIRVLLAQALFGNPDILLLDEPTNQLDYLSVIWLENYLLEFKNTVIVVSHDRHFLNKVCTHIADLDYKKIKIYPGNYNFWKTSSEMILKQREDKNKQSEAKVKELEDFVRRFSANASKSKQATSRKKLIEKLRPEEMPVSSRRSPYISFKPHRKCGENIVELTNVSHSIGGTEVLKNVSFKVLKNEKVAIVGDNSISKTALLDILSGDIKPDSGTVTWGETISYSYFPKDNSDFFSEDIELLDWIGQHSDSDDTQYLRGFLGRMLFSGEAVEKQVKVLSGGEKARAMFSKMMLTEGNVLILDDPTDHLDLEAISSLNDGLMNFPECLIFSSHDFQLLNTVANRIIEVSPKGMLDRRVSYDEYMQDEKLQAQREKVFG